MANVFKVRDDAGKTYDVDEDKLTDAESDGFLPVVSNGKEEHRVSLKDLGRAKVDGFEPVAGGHKSSTADAALRGAAQGFTGDFADEAYGVVGALVNPTNSDKDFADRYRDSRDYARGRDANAAQQHGKVFAGSKIAGGIGSAALVGPAAATLKGAAGLGAVSGFGGSEADLTKPSVDNVAQAALDTGLGGVGGAAGYGAGKAHWSGR
jgi:hypothetical protein